MSKILLILIALVVALPSKTLEYNVEFENLEDGDSLDYDLHLHMPFDSIFGVMNGNIDEDNISTSANLKQRVIDSVQYTTADWLYDYTRGWQTLDGTTRLLRGPRGITVYINDSTANSAPFAIVSDSTDTIALFYGDSLSLRETLIVNGQARVTDTLFVEYVDSVNTDDLIAATATITTLTVTNIGGDPTYDSLVLSPGPLRIGQTSGEPVGARALVSVCDSLNHPVNSSSMVHLTVGSTGLTGSDGSFLGVNAAGTLRLTNQEAADLYFTVNGAGTMSVNKNGTVLVGALPSASTDTTHALYVVGETRLDSLTYDSVTYFTSANTSPFVGHDTTYDPGTIPLDSCLAIAVNVPGAVLGDFAQVSFVDTTNATLNGVYVAQAQVTSTDNVGCLMCAKNVKGGGGGDFSPGLVHFRARVFSAD